MKRSLFALLVGLLPLALAQFPITQSFTGSTAPGWVLGGNAYLTSGNGDPSGNGWLRLTRNTTNQKGYAYYDTAFPSTLGLRIEFDFVAWGGTGGNIGADGISVFLFDGSTPSSSFKIGDFGGGLGYCQGYSNSLVGGLSNAYVGIALDEWGNFSNPNDRCPNGGPGQRPDSIAIRGPGNGNTGYAYLTGTGNRLGLNTSIDYETSTPTRPSSGSYYRRARIDLVPLGGVYQITVYLATAPNGPFTQVLGPYTMPSPPPPTLKIGFAGSTGSATNYHEIRNLSITSLVAPADLRVVQSGPSTVRVGDTVTYTVTVSNVGPNPLLGASFSDSVPAGITGVSWTCTGTGGGSCAASSGSGNNVSTTLNLPLNSSVTFTIAGTASPGAVGQTLTNTASAYPPQNYGDTNPQDNTSSVSTQVLGYTLSGAVYHDLQPNGAREAGEDWSSGATVYVKLVQGGTVLQVAAVAPGAGGYSFTNLVPGDYTLVLDDNNNPSDLTPTPPAGWHFIQPAGGQRSLTLGRADLAGQDFGLFRGTQLVGRVFYDDGLGGGTANNALQDGGEGGVAGVVVTATDGTNTRSATTDGAGNYLLWIPYAWGSVTLTQPLRPATGWNDGNTATRVADWGQATAPGTGLALGPASGLPKTLVRNFGVVRPSLLRPDASGQASSPGTVDYAHLYRPGTQGSLTLSAAGGGYTYLVRVDPACGGSGAFQALPLSLAVGTAWPRGSDGGLAACPLTLRVVVPPGVAAGSLDQVYLRARLVWANNGGVEETVYVLDTTAVQASGGLALSKAVRNYSQNGAWANTAAGQPGEILEYRIQYQNLSSAPVFQVVLSDPVPFFTDLLQDQWGQGEVLLTCPGGSQVAVDLGPTNLVRLDLAQRCPLNTAPYPGTGQPTPALLPGEGGSFLYRVRIR